MRCLFSARGRRVLKKFASARTLVAFDFDGTLAPIVSNRRRAAIRGTTRNLLATLATQYPCVVISGRARKDVQRRLRGIGIREIIGNHGIEPWSTSPALENVVRSWIPLLRDKLRRFRGVAIEDKRFSLAIHYRRETRKQQARAAIAAAARRLGAVRCVGGKQVVNFLPAGAPHKGLALERQLLKSRCNKAMYVGDDDTDEDVFALPRRDRLLTIRVGLKNDSLARYFIRSQREIDRLIRMLVELRARSQLRPARPSSH